MTKQTIQVDVPEGYRAVRYGFPTRGEYYLSCSSGFALVVVKATHDLSSLWLVLEKIPVYREPTIADQGTKCDAVVRSCGERDSGFRYLCPYQLDRAFHYVTDAVGSLHLASQVRILVKDEPMQRQHA